MFGSFVIAMLLAQTSDLPTARAQGEMTTRVETSVAAYAKRIGIDPSFISYCRSQMRLDTVHDSDGSIPFGFNYNTVTKKSDLDLEIEVREDFERSYLTLCLAKAKATLKAAE